MSVKQIVEQLKIARDFFYRGVPFLTDQQFDKLENRLKDLDPNNSYFKTVGTPVIRGLKKKHLIPMGSLDQLEEQQEIDRFKSSGEDTFFITDKLDGNSVAIYYDENGDFSHGLTRGDGIEGLDITRHIKRAIEIRKANNIDDQIIALRMPPNTVVRCEAIFIISDFNKYVKGYKNPRNYVAGQLNRLVAEETFLKYVRFVAFNSNRTDCDKNDMMTQLSKSGWHVVTHLTASGNNVNVKNLTKILEDHKAASLYQMDGIVIEYNNHEIRSRLGMNGLNPRYAFKFKINKTYVDTEVVDIHWQPSKDGYLKPRVEFEPVDLAGVTISFATGFNGKFIVDNNIGKHCVVRIIRSGDVIPKIDSVVKQGDKYTLPDCKTYGDYHWSESGVDIVLDHKPNISNILEITEFFIGIGVPMLKRGNITKLYEAGFNTIESIIKMSESDMVVVLGENGIKAYNGIRDKLTNIDEYVLAGSLPFFGRGVGKLKMKKIAETIGDLSNINYDDIMKISGFDNKTAKNICDGVDSYKNFVYNIGNYVSIKHYAKVSGKLNGWIFCFTGIRSKELEDEIIKRGGGITNTITNQTTHLVAKDISSNSTKIQKARSRGITIIGFEQAKRYVEDAS